MSVKADGRTFADANAAIAYLVSGHTKAELVDLLLVALGEDQPAVLLRATPEDRERLAAFLHRRDCAVARYDAARHTPVRHAPHGVHTDLADAIIAALRGES